MTHCEKCISYDICEFHQDMIADVFITFFPNNEDCPMFKNKADFVEVKQIGIIRDDLKWWLETNTEKGVVHIPKYTVENMIAKMDGERK